MHQEKDSLAEMKSPHELPSSTETSEGFIRGLFSSFILYPAFSYLWFAGLFSLTGVWMQTLVLGWVSYELTGSAFLLAVFTTARLSPMFLGPIGGVLADRLNRVRFMMVVFFCNGNCECGTSIAFKLRKTRILAYCCWWLSLGNRGCSFATCQGFYDY